MTATNPKTTTKPKSATKPKTTPKPRAPKAVGRPTDLTPTTIGKIEEALKIGSPIEAACAYAGVSPAIFYRWQTRGREDREAGVASRFVEFVERTEAAQHKSTFSLVVSPLARLAASGHYPSIVFIAKHGAAREFYRDKQELEVSGPGGTALPLGVLVINVPAEAPDDGGK